MHWPGLEEIRGKLSVRVIGLRYMLVCVSGLDGWNAIDSFQAAMASSNSSAIRHDIRLRIVGMSYHSLR